MAAQGHVAPITLLVLSFVIPAAASGDTLASCPVEPAPGEVIHRGAMGGGMTGSGWDGPGQNSATLYWHVEGTSDDLDEGQRAAMIAGLQAWANVVDVDFIEIATPNWIRSIDFDFQTGDHCAVESDECGDPDCPFDGAGGVLAHAGFPPGVNSQCTNPMAESFAGNVHFDDAELYEEDAGNGNAFSLTLMVAHETGHSLGLTHDLGPNGPHIMRSGFNTGDLMQAPSASDISNIRSGYAAGTGRVLTLNDVGIWVDGNWTWAEAGTPTEPFDTIGEAVAGIPPFTSGIVVHVEQGTYPEAMTIAEPLILRAEGGTVIVGSGALRAAAD